jgi:hypothetical protein
MFNYTPEALSAVTSLMAEISTAVLSAQEQLQAIATTPYEATKLALFGKEYKFPTIKDVEVPEAVTVDGLINKITEIENNYQKALLDVTINPESYTIDNFSDPNNNISILAELSGENTYVVTEQKYKNYIEYLELVGSIDYDSINKDNSYDIIKKLGYYYVTAMSKKTISL